MASPPEVARTVVDLAASRAPTLGVGRLVCIDGPAGSGKTTLAAEVSALTGAQVVHADDLMEGWRGLAAVERQLTGIVTDLLSGVASSYRRYDWLHERYAARPVDVPRAAWLVAEGVGSGAPAVAAHATVLVWVEADDDLRLARGLARDGRDLEPHWHRFMEDEATLFAEHGTRERADVLVDGSGARPPRVTA